MPSSGAQSPRADEDMAEAAKADAKVVVVKNLSRNVVEQHLIAIFGYYGEIDTVKIPLYAKSGQSRGTAFIEFADSSAAVQAASHMDSGFIDGATVSVEVSNLPIPSISHSPPLQRGRGNREKASRPHASSLPRSWSRSRSRSLSPPRRRPASKRSPPSMYPARGVARGGRGRYTAGARRDERRRSYSRSQSFSPPRRAMRRRSPSYERGGTAQNPRLSRYDSRSLTRGRYSSRSSRSRSWSSRSRTRSLTPYSSRSRSRSQSGHRRSRSRDDIRDSNSRSRSSH